jgi:uncharacterized protein (TIGR02246 family)
MKRTIAAAALALVTLSVALAGDDSTVKPAFLNGLSATDGAKVIKLLQDLPNTDINSLVPLTIQPYALPKAGVDVMRVKMDETYAVDGIGKDTIQLSGWIAVIHHDARPAPGEKEIRWGTAISDTEFVGMDLRGDSQIFGPVRVTLNPAYRSRGVVGKLSLSIMDSIMLDLVYGEHRITIISRQNVPTGPAANLPAGVGRFGSFFQPPSTPKMSRAQAAVADVVKNVFNAISDKSAEKMLSFYDKSPDNVFFNTSVGKEIRGAETYVNTLAKMFSQIRTIKVIPDNDMNVVVSGPLAVVTATGINDVVDNEGHRGTGPWEVTIQLQKRGDRWLITHDQFSFRDVQSVQALAGRPNEISRVSAAAKCIANIEANIAMNRLNLNMQAKSPIQWYSEVDTIPPVGFTASVSLFPTRLQSEGRSVATLEHGAVRFREVVMHVPLDGPFRIDNP